MEPSGTGHMRSQQQGSFAGASAPHSHQASLQSTSLTQKSIDVVELENKKLKQKLEKVGFPSGHSLAPSSPPALPLHKTRKRRGVKVCEGGQALFQE